MCARSGIEPDDVGVFVSAQLALGSRCWFTRGGNVVHVVRADPAGCGGDVRRGER